MMKMKILLTGGTGFFGKSLLGYLNHKTQLIAHGDHLEITLMSRTPARFVKEYPEFKGRPWLKFHTGNILDPSSFPTDEKFTDVMHFATDSVDGIGSTRINKLDQIVSGTRNTLDFAVKAGASRFLFTSSGAVYGEQPEHLPAMAESYHGTPDSLNTINVYGLAKRHAELLCALYAEQFGISVKIARCFAFVGPDLPLSAHFAIGNFIKSALDGSPIVIKGDGSPVRTYLFQNDLAHWLLKILADGKPGQAYNVGSDESISIRELASLVRDVLAPAATIMILGETQNKHRDLYVPNIQKAKIELGLEVTLSLRDAIKQTGELLMNRNL